MPFGDINNGAFSGKTLYYVNPKIKAGKFVVSGKTETGERLQEDCSYVAGVLKNAYLKVNEAGKFGTKTELHIILEDETSRLNFGVDIRSSWFAGKFARNLFSAKYMQQIQLLILPVKGSDSYYGLVTDIAGKQLQEAFNKETMPKWVPVIVNGKQVVAGGFPVWDKSEQEAFIDEKIAQWLTQFPAQKVEGEVESDEAKFNRYFPQAAELSKPTITQEEPEDLLF